LAKDWHWEKPSQQSAFANDILHRAIIGQVEGKLEINFGRSYVAGHPKYPLSDAAPPLTGLQEEEALCILTDIARKRCFQLDTQVGDILFVNNLSIMHARNAFVGTMRSSITPGMCCGSSFGTVRRAGQLLLR
jgi:hypothetical protein